ncbi:hypothetical protein GCK32_014916 [Trichostrongylus colubriformis]|uniref:Uncharacterized protein n=1 Tax=Trichostrongylus colubriformis TaxID=6319 RepID=A0AAN8IGS7_TRICO
MNEICQLSARISELTDHVEKARLRENELTERVARWVEHLREEKQKMLSRGSRLYATGTLSAIVSDDIEYNIGMLMQKRARVDQKLLETKQRKKEHKYQLKQMKQEMLLMHQELGDWDNKYDEICELLKLMDNTRRQLQERIKEQQQKETAAKLTCIELDKKLHELYDSITNEDETLKDDSNISNMETMRYHFAITTSESHQEVPTRRGISRMGQSVKL